MKRDSPSAGDGGGGGGGAPVRKGKRRRIKRTKVDHTYRDFSKLSLESVSLQLKLAGQDVGGDVGGDGGSGGRSNKSMSFPRKLYDMVTNPQYQHIIRFMPHGRSWVVLDKVALVSEVLPKYFNHSKFESFNRQVNGWGYKRLLKRGPDYKSYYHECFLRGRPELTTLMVRLVNPGKRTPDLEGEPDFYEISRRNPLPEIGEPVSLINEVTSSSNEGGSNNNSTPWSMLGGNSDSTPHIHHQALLHPSAPSEAPHWAQAQDPLQAFRLRQAAATQAVPTYQQGLNYYSQGTDNFTPMQGFSGISSRCQGMSNTAQFTPTQEVPSVGTRSTADAVQTSHEWVEKVSHSKLPVMTNSHHAVSESSNKYSVDDFDNNFLEKYDISDYDIEPAPLPERPVQVNTCFISMDDYLSNIKEPGPLLEDFAGMYFSNGQSLSDSIHN